MAELVVFGLACNILSTVASPVFEKAYEKGLSIWEAREELVKLRVTIETIQAVLLDAEKKQEGSTAVKSWIKRLKGVLYNADDLFEEVVTDDLLKQQIMKGKGNVFSKKVVKCVVHAFELKQLQYDKGIEQQHETKSKRLLTLLRPTFKCRWKLPVSLQQLEICCYPGIRISELYGCKKVKYLPSLRWLPNLRRLDLHKLSELEFVENEDKHSCCIEGGGDGSRFFPLLEELRLYHLPKLKGWQRKVATSSSSTTSASTPPRFPLLSELYFKRCPVLE